MPVIIHYFGTTPILKNATAKANAILQSARLYDVIRSRFSPFDQSFPDNTKPTTIADLLEQTNMETYIKETKINSQVLGRYDPRYAKVLSVNSGVVTKYNADAIAAMLIHQCVIIVSHHSEEYRFDYQTNQVSHNINTAPYWIQQKVRENFGDIPNEKRSTQYLIEVILKM